MSEREICGQWKVTTITARQALEVLRAEGLVFGVRGKGTFVRKPQPLRRVAPQRYWRPHTAATYEHEAQAADRSVTTDHTVTAVRAPADVADRLGLSVDARVQQITYLIRMDDQPICSSVCWEPLSITGGTPIQNPQTGPHAGAGIVPRFDAIGVHVDRVREVLTIRMPDPEEAVTLEIPPGVPVVQIQQTFTADGQALQTADIVYPADRYTLEYDMEIR